MKIGKLDDVLMLSECADGSKRTNNEHSCFIKWNMKGWNSNNDLK